MSKKSSASEKPGFGKNDGSRRRAPSLHDQPVDFTNGTMSQAYQVLDNLSDSVFVGMVTLRGIVDYVNRAALEAVGERLEDVVGHAVEMTPWFAQSASSQQQWRSALHTASNGQPARFQFAFKDVNGIVRTIDLTLQPVFDKSSHVAHYVFTGLDITERRRVERLLRLSDFAIECTRLALVQVGADGNVCRVNDSACVLLDYPKQELLGMPIARLSHNVARLGWAKVWGRLRTRGSLQYETSYVRADGCKIPVELYTSYVKYEGHENAFIFINDISEKKSAEQHIQFLAKFDALTALPNRVSFLQSVRKSLDRIDAENSAIAVAISDVERFWSINNSFGRKAADMLLTQMADRLVNCIEDKERLARIGADQFAFIVIGISDSEQLEKYIERQYKAVYSAPFQIDGHPVRASGKFGVATYPEAGTDAETLLRHAEIALNRAKDVTERCLIYTPGMSHLTAADVQLETKLRGALERNEFMLRYQPKVTLVDRRIAGCEALLRWQDAELGMVPPVQFIPILERTGLILEIGAWVLQRAAQDYRSWVGQGLTAPRIAVNVSVIQLRTRNFVQVLEAETRRNDGPVGIDIEITETAVMEDIDDSIKKLKAIHDMGVQIGIDDFGTGYSSLAYLTKLPAQIVKIDHSFISTMLDDPDKKTLIAGIISLAHALRLKVVAEGVETVEQEQALHSLGCDQMQGYLFSKPISAQEMSSLLPKS
ncbi:EAL domain-containing protein [Oxalobacteraceae bacterium OM1]|nr:EAL domain-containing protein [Oxalobacteraceae bacterium OM1]